MSISEVRLFTYLVEFGPLDDEQQATVDLHAMRALETEPWSEGDGVVVAFRLRDGEQPEAAFDDMRGWAIVNRLPIRRLVAQPDRR